MRNNLKLQSNNKLTVLEKEFIWKIIFSSYIFGEQKDMDGGETRKQEGKKARKRNHRKAFTFSCTLLSRFPFLKAMKIMFFNFNFCLHLFIQKLLNNNVPLYWNLF